MTLQYVSRLFFLKYENVTWIQYIPFKRDVRALKHLIELGSEIVDINYSVRARLMRPTSTVSRVA